MRPRWATLEDRAAPASSPADAGDGPTNAPPRDAARRAGGPANKALLRLLLTLSPGDDRLQAALVIAVLQASPELVRPYGLAVTLRWN